MNDGNGSDPLDASKPRVICGVELPDPQRIAALLLELGAAVEEKERRISEMLRRAIAASDLSLVRELLALWRGENHAFDKK